jgi:hypothetical protein
VLGRPLLAGAPRAVAATSAPRTARYCTNCATVEAVNVVEVNGQGNYLGTGRRGGRRPAGQPGG